MPFYEFDLTVPKLTAAAAPARVAARLTRGVVVGVAVQIPRGCAGLVEARIRRADHQVWPANPGGSFKGEGAIIRWRDSYRLDDEPLSLVLEGWGPSARYPHKLTFRFELVTLAEAEAAGEQRGLVARLAEFVGLGPSRAG